MAHVKPKNRRMWDVHKDKGFNIGMATEHYQCFLVYIVKTRATRVSDRVFFKHQYITNPQIMPETLVIKVVAELTNVLKGTVSREVETAEALQKVSSLFTKIAAAKAATTRAREQETHPTLCQPIPLPRVIDRPPTQTVPVPRVPIAPSEADCHVRLVDGSVQIVDSTTSWQGNHEPPTARPPTQIVGSRLQIFEDVTPHQGNHGPPSARPNYISQEESAKPWRGYNTLLRTTSIMQEAMLACIDITKPQFKISPANMAAKNSQ
jgi:hypothetical protein